MEILPSRLRLLPDRWSMSGMIRLLNTGKQSLFNGHITPAWSSTQLLYKLLAGRGCWMRQSWSVSTWGELMWSGSDQWSYWSYKQKHLQLLVTLVKIDTVMIIKTHLPWVSIYKPKSIDFNERIWWLVCAIGVGGQILVIYKYLLFGVVPYDILKLVH